jgi:hypothetical protein
MTDIDKKTKLLLGNKNWQNPKSLEDLGYIFFGPIVFNFFVWLKNESVNSDKILFNSREGYFLKQIADTFNDVFNLPKCIYFKTSRKLSYMASFFNEDDVYNSFKLHKYKGSLKDMMLNRFGINIVDDFQIDTTIYVPNLNDYMDLILNNSNMIRMEYGRYIRDIIGDSKNIIMVDNGYQGSTQYNIEKSYDLNFKGRYFTYKGNENLKDVKGFYNFDECKLKDNFIFFESVFIDKIGSFIDIKNGVFINEKTKSDELCFEEKQKIIKGIKFFIRDIINLNPNLNEVSFKFSDYLFNLMCSKDYIVNDDLFKSFFHDNTYTRNFTKKIERR